MAAPYVKRHWLIYILMAPMSEYRAVALTLPNRLCPVQLNQFISYGVSGRGLSHMVITVRQIHLPV